MSNLFERMSRIARDVPEPGDIPMQFFHEVTDGNAIVRLPKGVYNQTKLYRRGDRLYIPHGGGYVRMTAKFGDEYGTSHPDVKVIELDTSFDIGRDGIPKARL